MLKIQLIGHLGQDAKINQVNNVEVLNFSVAHTERFKNAEGNNVEKTMWINCQLWNNIKLAAYLTKGRSVYIEGFPSANMFTNKEGVKMVGLNCRVTTVQLIGKNAQSDGAPASSTTTPAQSDEVDEFENFMNEPNKKDVF